MERNSFVLDLAPVVQKVDTAIHWINLYPVDSTIGFPNTYPLDSDIQRFSNPGQANMQNMAAIFVRA